VRALARDLGERVGSAAYLCALVRTASGPFRLEDAHALDEIRDAAAHAGPNGVRKLLLPVDAGLDGIPSVGLTAAEIADATQGRFVRPAAGIRGADDGATVRLVDAEGTIVGLGRRDGSRVAPTKILGR
jgi:tRNA pseudouridine55 synthase